MIAITRYRVPESEAEAFAAELGAILESLSGAPGYRTGRIGRTVDDPTRWALITEWDGAGHYRRGIGLPQVRMRLIPLSALAVDEPGAYEIIAAR